jgi:hypothetical protein
MRLAYFCFIAVALAVLSGMSLGISMGTPAGATSS